MESIQIFDFNQQKKKKPREKKEAPPTGTNDRFFRILEFSHGFSSIWIAFILFIFNEFFSNFCDISLGFVFIFLFRSCS